MHGYNLAKADSLARLDPPTGVANCWTAHTCDQFMTRILMLSYYKIFKRNGFQARHKAINVKKRFKNWLNES